MTMFCAVTSRILTGFQCYWAFRKLEIRAVQTRPRTLESDGYSRSYSTERHQHRPQSGACVDRENPRYFLCTTVGFNTTGCSKTAATLKRFSEENLEDCDDDVWCRNTNTRRILKKAWKNVCGSQKKT